MPEPDALLIDGVEIPEDLPEEFATGICVDGPPIWGHLQADQRGEFPTYQGFDGVGYTVQPYNAFVLPYYLTLSAPICDEDGAPIDPTEWLNGAYAAVRVACKPDREVTLTRRRSWPDMGGTEQTARAKLSMVTPSRPRIDTLLCVVEFVILDGIWYGPEATTATFDTDESITADGDTRTHRIQVDLTAGDSSPSLVNAANGYGFTFDASVPSTVTVDVEARTAVRVSTGQDLSRYLSWSKTHLLRIEPGENLLVPSNHATVTVRYAPAYL